MKTFLFALIPPPYIQRQLAVLSVSIFGITGLPPVLRDGAIPHITVVQWQAESYVALQPRVSRFMSVGIEHLEMAGLRLLPSSRGGVWIDVPILLTDDLRKLQSRVLRGTKDVATPSYGTGDRYRPHLTVGYSERLPSRLPDLPADLLRADTGPWLPVFGEADSDFTFKRFIDGPPSTTFAA